MIEHISPFEDMAGSQKSEIIERIPAWKEQDDCLLDTDNNEIAMRVQNEDATTALHLACQWEPMAKQYLKVLLMGKLLPQSAPGHIFSSCSFYTMEKEETLNTSDVEDEGRWLKTLSERPKKLLTNDDDHDSDDDHDNDDGHDNDDHDNHAVINKNEYFLRIDIYSFGLRLAFMVNDCELKLCFDEMERWFYIPMERRKRQKRLLEEDMPRPSGLSMMEQQRLWQVVKIEGEAVNGHMKHEPWTFGNGLMIKTKVIHMFLISIGNSDNTLLGLSDNTHSLSDETKQDFEYNDEATVRQNNLKKSKNETRSSQDNMEINNQATVSQDNMQINNQREHPISSDQTREASRPHSTLWKMLGRNLPILTVLMAVYVLSQHNVLVTSIVGLFFIQMFANKIYCVFFDCKNDETIRNNYPADLVRNAMGFLVPMMLIQLQLAAVVMWQFHETHLAREPKINELPSFVVLGLMTFHVLLQFTFHVIDFARLLM